MILLDTSALVDSLCGRQLSWPGLRMWIESGVRVEISALVLYEFLRGPRIVEEIVLQQGMFPEHSVLPFGYPEATLCAEFYRTLPRARAREFDFAIAAGAITGGAALWTLNSEDFEDIPGLKLVRPDMA